MILRVLAQQNTTAVKASALEGREGFLDAGEFVLQVGELGLHVLDEKQSVFISMRSRPAFKYKHISFVYINDITPVLEQEPNGILHRALRCRRRH